MKILKRNLVKTQGKEFLIIRVTQLIASALHRTNHHFMSLGDILISVLTMTGCVRERACESDPSAEDWLLPVKYLRAQLLKD